MPAEQKQEFSSVESLMAQLADCASRGMTEVSVHDTAFAASRKAVRAFLSAVQRDAPQLFVSLVVRPEVIDRDVARDAAAAYCALDIPLSGTEKNGALLFDKKLYASKAALLNEAGAVFGFDMGFGAQAGDTFKAFRERLDFAMTLYPNHVDFFQIENEELPQPTGVFSSKDLDFARGMAFACKTFYTAGRAVPWFNSVLSPLRIAPSAFFADFEEWQHCNNCSWESGFDVDAAAHAVIEEMQLRFLSEKYAEKHKEHLFAAVSDVVRLNGAFSRVRLPHTVKEL